MLRKLLTHPIARGLNIDAPETTGARRRILAAKPFLQLIYEEWYRAIAAQVPTGTGSVLELGSGAGFLERFIPGLITSDFLAVSGVSRVVDAHHLPFPPASLRAIVMTNVLHHLPEPRRFFHEASRCVRPGGALVMLEPWSSAWSQLIYRRLHHEPFEPEAPQWEFPSTGPLSGANGALPCILFQRDRPQFEREFPQWRIDRIEPTMPFRYLLSGGVSLRCFVPSWTHSFWRWIEHRMHRWRDTWAMFALIVVTRTDIDQTLTYPHGRASDGSDHLPAQRSRDRARSFVGPT